MPQINKQPRIKYDEYNTPIEAIMPLLPLLPKNLTKKRILEPCAGNGNIIKAIKLYNQQQFKSGKIDVAAIEIQKKKEKRLRKLTDDVSIEDFLLVSKIDMFVGFDCIITNPPFSLALEFLEEFMILRRRFHTKIYTLLRMDFLGSIKRHKFWKGHKPNMICVLSKRPSFTGKKNDYANYAWIGWDGRETMIDFLL